MLTYFATVDAALKMGELLYEKLPAFPYDRNIWGRQLVMDEHDQVQGEVDRLLTGAAELDITTVKHLCEELGGVAVPAHVDKDSFSLLSVLGFAPEDLPFEAYEVKRPEHNLQKLLNAGRLPSGQEILTSSDAHQLADIAEHPRTLPANSCLLRLLG